MPTPRSPSSSPWSPLTRSTIASLFSLRDAPAGMTIDGAAPFAGTHRRRRPPTPSLVEIDDGRGEPVLVPVSLTVDAEAFLFVAAERRR